MSKSIEDVFDGGEERKIGVSRLLPALAADELVRAANKARTLPVGSLARSKCIAQAIAKVMAEWPAFFKKEAPASASMRVPGCGISHGQDEGAGQ